mgnify:CR=1 FL=1
MNIFSVMADSNRRLVIPEYRLLSPDNPYIQKLLGNPQLRRGWESAPGGSVSAPCFSYAKCSGHLVSVVEKLGRRNP